MPATLLESAKTMEPGLNRAVIEIFANESAILGALPFATVPNGVWTYNLEDSLPGIGFRGINEAYPESVGVLNPQTETLSIAGGDADVDNYLLETNPGYRAIGTSGKLKAMSLAWGSKFIKGDSVSNPAEFDGLQKRLVVGGNQVIDAGATSGGDALSLYLLDKAIKRTKSPTHLIMTKDMVSRFTQASRNMNVGGNITFTQDQMGNQVTRFAGIPILEIGEDNTGTDILGFTEANPGGGAPASTSIYIVSLNLDTLFGIQSSLPKSRDLGELESKPARRTRVEWFSGFVLQHPRAATRLRGIKDAAIVA